MRVLLSGVGLCASVSVGVCVRGCVCVRERLRARVRACMLVCSRPFFVSMFVGEGVRVRVCAHSCLCA
jgi:hypothetical protein